MTDRKEYIERGVIEKSLEATPIRIAADKGKIFRVIKNIPAADVMDVVRCSQCKHWYRGDCYRLELSRPDDYCSYGERKDGADNAAD